ncbi:hypothetical protein [Fictibacillus solisalsi]|uniref:hypothetical protein n=1 Tax=Fictibacillus solisalsi TaxID=459525 RepID=UPI0011145263|nr:hypothetical protein [Fictibacillus solisalsi]
MLISEVVDFRFRMPTFHGAYCGSYHVDALPVPAPPLPVPAPPLPVQAPPLPVPAPPLPVQAPVMLSRLEKKRFGIEAPYEENVVLIFEDLTPGITHLINKEILISVWRATIF